MDAHVGRLNGGHQAELLEGLRPGRLLAVVDRHGAHRGHRTAGLTQLQNSSGMFSICEDQALGAAPHLASATAEHAEGHVGGRVFVWSSGELWSVQLSSLR
jgi:hypothetical protein